MSKPLTLNLDDLDVVTFDLAASPRFFAVVSDPDPVSDPVSEPTTQEDTCLQVCPTDDTCTMLGCTKAALH